MPEGKTLDVKVGSAETSTGINACGNMYVEENATIQAESGSDYAGMTYCVFTNIVIIY